MAPIRHGFESCGKIGVVITYKDVSVEADNPVVVSIKLSDQQRLRERIHKLRNVLGMISAFGELLALEKLSEKGTDRTKRIVAGVMEARDILEEIHSVIVPKGPSA
ncbi:MAG: hypothetical protein HYX75_07965 [Acidobacteria bacterium]|nr:hypothetical protein [Acidobacteriota bacterium]